MDWVSAPLGANVSVPPSNPALNAPPVVTDACARPPPPLGSGTTGTTTAAAAPAPLLEASTAKAPPRPRSSAFMKVSCCAGAGAGGSSVLLVTTTGMVLTFATYSVWPEAPVRQPAVLQASTAPSPTVTVMLLPYMTAYSVPRIPIVATWV